MSYSWSAPSSAGAALVPLGLMGGRTFVTNDTGTAVDLDIGLYEVNRSPSGGPNRQLKFGVSFFF